MALKKSELYSSLWQSCDELRGGMDASQYKDYVLVLLFIKYVSDKYAGQPYTPITIPSGAGFKDMVAKGAMLGFPVVNVRVEVTDGNAHSVDSSEMAFEIAGSMAVLFHDCETSYFDNHRGFVFFGIRTMKDAFFLEELSAFKARAPRNLHITVALSDQDAPAAERTAWPTLDYATGFVHKVTAEKLSGAFDNMAAFVAGPPPMVDGAIRMLIMEGRLPAADIRYDKFS